MKVLLVDDDAEIVSSVRIGFELGWPGVEFLSAGTGESGLAAVEESRPDLVLLDVGLPDTDGYAVLADIRRFSDVPVIMLTARDESIDRVRGLEAGADDHVGKPFDHLELLARVRAVLRRLDARAPARGGAVVRSGELEIDTAARHVAVGGRPVTLTATEWRLLETLARNPGWVVPYDRLVLRVWGHDSEATRESLRVFVRRLRAKIGDDAANPRHIETVRGAGYRFLAG